MCWLCKVGPKIECTNILLRYPIVKEISIFLSYCENIRGVSPYRQPSTVSVTIIIWFSELTRLRYFTKCLALTCNRHINKVNRYQVFPSQIESKPCIVALPLGRGYYWAWSGGYICIVRARHLDLDTE